MEPDASSPKARYQPEGISGPESEAMYKDQLQINLAKLAFPDATKPMNAWVGDTEDNATLAARFRAWFENPERPHIHLDDVNAQNALLTELRGPTIH
jgi:hypothetical protein